jgi:hypothetical protein
MPNVEFVKRLQDHATTHRQRATQLQRDADANHGAAQVCEAMLAEIDKQAETPPVKMAANDEE